MLLNIPAKYIKKEPWLPQSWLVKKNPTLVWIAVPSSVKSVLGEQKGIHLDVFYARYESFSLNSQEVSFILWFSLEMGRMLKPTYAKKRTERTRVKTFFVGAYFLNQELPFISNSIEEISVA